MDREGGAGGEGCSQGMLPPHPSSHRLRTHLLLLQPPKRLSDELDVLAAQRGQLTVARPQVHVLGDQKAARSQRGGERDYSPPGLPRPLTGLGQREPPQKASPAPQGHV